jgi:hypothetical protein
VERNDMMDSELQRLEAELERLAPGSLPEGLISRMEAAMEGWQEVSEEVSKEIDKVVPFPRSDENRDARRRGGPSYWAAAASVALLGAVAAMVFTANPQNNESVDRGPLVDPDAVRKVEFSPLTAKRTILDASDQNVIIANGSQPMRLMRLDYVDRVVFRNAAGEEVHLEVPSVNYLLVPAPTD